MIVYDGIMIFSLLLLIDITALLIHANLSDLDGAIVDQQTCFASIGSTVMWTKGNKLKIMTSS